MQKQLSELAGFFWIVTSRVAAVLIVLMSLQSGVSSAAVPVRYLFGRADFPTSAQPKAVATADLNSDNKLDLVVANNGAGSISVFLGRLDGTFGAKADFAAGTNPSGVAIGDFNGDGRPDVAVVNAGANTFSILLGNGNGTFQSHVDYPISIQPSAIIGGDFNRDGKFDLAITSSFSGIVSVLLGRGDGTFGQRIDYATGSAPVHVITADINTDGNLDLIVANSGSNSVSVFIANGDGSFSSGIQYPAGSQPSAVAAASFGTGGPVDLAVANSGSSTVSILPGIGDGRFLAKTDYATSGGPAGITVGDFNDDGFVDVAVTSQTTLLVSILLGKLDGTFNAHLDYGVGISPTAIVSADFSGDGLLDLAITNSDANSLSVILGNGDGTFCPRVDLSVGHAPFSLTSGDYNKDGTADIASYASAGNGQLNSVNVFLSDGAGSFSGVAPFYISQLVSFITADVNGDGNLDIIASTAANANFVLTVSTGNGNGTFTSKSSFATCWDTWQIAAGDFNGDLKQDIVIVCRNDSAIKLHLGNGDGTFQTGQSFPAGTYPQALVTGDFNGDGRLDVVVANSNCINANCQPGGTISMLLGNGNGTFQTKRDFNVGAGPVGMTAGDFNHDGKLDAAVVNNNCVQVVCGPGTISILLGNGDGTFQPRVDYAVSRAPGFPGSMGSSMAAIDLNRDGNLDIAVQTGIANNLTSSTFSVLIGNGDGTFLPRLDYASQGQQMALTSNDFNADGTPDVAVTNYGFDSASAFLSTPVAALYPSALSFGNTAVGLTSPSQSITLTNSSSAPLKLTTIATLGDFGQANNCGSLLSPGQACTVQVSFSPTTLGPRSGKVIFSDNAAGRSQFIQLSGTGVSGSPPSPAPSNPSPGNAASGVSRNSTLNWTGSVGATSYDVYLGTSPTPPLVANIGSTSYAPGTLSAGATYFWKVVAKNSFGTNSSATWSFTTSTQLGISNGGVFRSSGFWAIDGNRNWQWDASDRYLWLGQAGDIPVAGDFDGDGVVEIGVFRNGFWAIDINHNGQWDAGDLYTWLGQAGDIPVVGDFNGDARDEMGVFRGGFWAIDLNHNGQWDVSDKYVWLGQAGDVPVVGDFNGDGIAEMGVFRSGFWAVDLNRNGVWDASDKYVWLGQSGDVPVVGDFNGDGIAEMGVFRSGFWAIDLNRNGAWDASDGYYWLGQVGDVPMVLR